MFKIGCAWAILEVGPFGAQPIPPKPNLAGAYSDAWLSLQELHVSGDVGLMYMPFLKVLPK
jgi:hypothetical protein